MCICIYIYTCVHCIHTFMQRTIVAYVYTYVHMTTNNKVIMPIYSKYRRMCLELRCFWKPYFVFGACYGSIGIGCPVANPTRYLRSPWSRERGRHALNYLTDDALFTEVAVHEQRASYRAAGKYSQYADCIEQASHKYKYGSADLRARRVWLSNTLTAYVRSILSRLLCMCVCVSISMPDYV